MKRRRAFTLIELLIVIAILSILVTASLAMMVGPLRERVFAERTAAAEAGINLALATLIGDLHSAAEVRPAGTGYAIVSADGRTAAWSVDASRTLRVRNSAILSDVVEFKLTPSPDGRSALIALRAEWTLLQQPFTAARTATVALGTAWTGARP